MHPRLGSWGGLIFHAYGTCLVIAAPVCLFLLVVLLKRRGVSRAPAVDLSIAALLGYWLGARLMYGIVHGDVSRAWAESGVYGAWGGQIVFGALSLAYLAFACRAVRDTADALAVAWAALTVPVKLGCFLAGCCHGAPTTLPWAVTFPKDSYCGLAGVPIHPTQLYDAGSALLLGIVLLIAFLRGAARGRLLLWFLLGYSLLKLGSEFFRGDHRVPVAGGWTASMLIELASAIGCGGLLALGLRLDALLDRLERRSGPVPSPDGIPGPVFAIEILVAVLAVIPAALLGRNAGPASWFLVWIAAQFFLGGRVVDKTGTPAPAGQRLARGLVQALTSATVLGLLRPLLDPERRTAGDALAETWIRRRPSPPGPR